MDNHKMPLSLHLLLPFMPLRSSFHYVTPSHFSSFISTFAISRNDRTFPLPLHATGLNSPRVVILTQSNLYDIFLLCVHTHTHTASLQGLKQKPLLYYSGRHAQVKHELISLQNQILYKKKTGRHRRLNISMTYCGNCRDQKSPTAIRLSRLLAGP